MTTVSGWFQGLACGEGLASAKSPAKKYLEFVSQTRGTVSPSWINNHFKRVIGNNQKLERNGKKMIA